jgi:hypothetical protein|tara:strand:+ start:503 stop:760 length:258 start_codon:yes stop_codon:yes gene_type:complete
MKNEPITKVSIRPHMHGLYRYAHQVIIDSVPADQGREFLLEMNRYSQELLGKCQELGVVPMDDDDGVDRVRNPDTPLPIATEVSE